MGQLHYHLKVVSVAYLARHTSVILVAAPADPPSRTVEGETGGGPGALRTSPPDPNLPPPPPREPPARFSIQYDRWRVIESLTNEGRGLAGTTVEVLSPMNDERQRMAIDFASGRSNHPVFDRYALMPSPAAHPAEALGPEDPRILFLHKDGPATLRYAYGDVALPVGHRREIEAALEPPHRTLLQRVEVTVRRCLQIEPPEPKQWVYRPNLLLVGASDSGKATAARRIVAMLPPGKVGGFLTEEIREGGSRVGFRIARLDGPAAILAHVDFDSKCRVGKYRVNVDALDQLFAPELPEADAYVLDEIGRMACQSGVFVRTVAKLLDSRKPVIATVGGGAGEFGEAVKRRVDAVQWDVTPANCDEIPGGAARWFGFPTPR
jgi:nucleoside-triphosphatase